MSSYFTTGAGTAGGVMGIREDVNDEKKAARKVYGEKLSGVKPNDENDKHAVKNKIDQNMNYIDLDMNNIDRDMNNIDQGINNIDRNMTNRNMNTKTNNNMRYNGGAARYAKYFCLAAAVILIAAGIAVGEPATVLGKAQMICLECIGIG